LADIQLGDLDEALEVVTQDRPFDRHPWNGWNTKETTEEEKPLTCASDILVTRALPQQPSAGPASLLYWTTSPDGPVQLYARQGSFMGSPLDQVTLAETSSRQSVTLPSRAAIY
jgi:hypothetical protein